MVMRLSPEILYTLSGGPRVWRDTPKNIKPFLVVHPKVEGFPQQKDLLSRSIDRMAVTVTVNKNKIR